MTRAFALCIALLGHVTGSDVTNAGYDVTQASTSDPIHHLTRLTEQLSHQVGQLTSKVKDLETRLAKGMGEKGKQIAALNHTMKLRTDHLTSLDHFCHDHVTNLNSRIKNLESPVAFSVYYTNDSVGSLYRNDSHFNVLLFDAVRFQAGGHHYNSTTGYFTAPSQGNYVFFLTVMRNNPNGDGCVQAAVMVKGHVFLTAATACAPGYTSATNLAPVRLNKGDTAYVQSYQFNKIFAFTHTTFTGFKISD